MSEPRKTCAADALSLCGSRASFFIPISNMPLYLRQSVADVVSLAVVVAFVVVDGRVESD